MGQELTGTLACWPPKGWPEFAKIPPKGQQALAKDPDGTRIYGVQYKIVSVPIFKMNIPLFRHDVSIDGWHYSILNDSQEYPILSFSLYDRLQTLYTKDGSITDLRSFGTYLPLTRKSSQRAISAGLFFIRQILNGAVPDTARVLKTYKIHPLQASLYHREMGLIRPLKDFFPRGFDKSLGGLK